MGDFRSTLRCVLCLSGTAAAFVLIEMLLEILMYKDSPHFGMQLGGVLVGGLIALSIPYCGWHGANTRDDKLLCLFSNCNYCMGCADAILVCVWGFFGMILAGMGEVAKKCDPEHPSADCDADTRKTMYELCNNWSTAFNEAVKNDSEIALNVNTTEVNVLLSEEKCIDTLHTLSTVVFSISCVIMVLRCAGLCFHCSSGYYGGELRTMLKDRHEDFHSESDSDY